MLKRGRYLPQKIQSSHLKYVPRTFTTLKAGIFKKTCSALLTSKIKQKFCRMVRQNSGDDYKQLLDEVFVISGIIKVEVSVISRSRRLRLITLTEALIIPDITKTESNNCFIIHCFEENNDKRIIAAITVYCCPCT